MREPWSFSYICFVNFGVLVGILFGGKEKEYLVIIVFTLILGSIIQGVYKD